MMDHPMTGVQTPMLKTIAFFDAMDYPPSWTEVMAWGEFESRPPIADLEHAKRSLIASGVVEEGSGRVALHGRLDTLVRLVRERTPLFPRKVRTARKVARWLTRNPNVRFVALANTTALAHSRDGGDLDFFVVVRHGALWSTRLVSGSLYRVTGRLSGPNEGRDAVCLSYFISDRGLDLSKQMLPNGDDPYFRYWFLALLPLYDDGVSRELWDANSAITSCHRCAERWMTSPDLHVESPILRISGISLFEQPARAFQMKWFPQNIRDRMGKGTDVIVSEDVLKFHVDDGRVRYRDAYQQRLHNLGL